MPTILGYGIAVLSVAIAVVLDFFVLRQFEAVLTPFLFAVAATVWYAGTGPGVLAIVLSVLSLNYFSCLPFFPSAQSAMPISFTWPLHILRAGCRLGQHHASTDRARAPSGPRGAGGHGGGTDRQLTAQRSLSGGGTEAKPLRCDGLQGLDSFLWIGRDLPHLGLIRRRVFQTAKPCCNGFTRTTDDG